MLPKPKSRIRSRPPSGLDAGKVTLDMVAEAAGVSPATVSRILNGSAVVSDAKRSAVEQAVARLGFVPNPVARGLAGGRTLSIGVVTLSVDSPFYGTALRGIEDELDPAGYSPLFVSGHWDTRLEARCIETLQSRRVDGIIVLTGRLGDQALRAYARTVPIVVTGRKLRAAGLYALDFDNLGGGRMATEHLLEQGHRRIAYIAGDAGHPDADARFNGYRAALEAAGVKFDPTLVVSGAYVEESGVQAVEALFAAGCKFSAIQAANDQMAFGALLALYRRGLRVPDDVSLVGFDDVPASQYSIPPLCTVHQPVYDLGRLAASALLQLLAGEKPTTTMPPPRFVERESTRAVRG